MSENDYYDGSSDDDSYNDSHGKTDENCIAMEFSMEFS